MSFQSPLLWAFFVIKNMESITGANAIEKMRRLKSVPDAVFGIIFLTADRNRSKYGERRKYEKCRLRPAMRDEGLSVSADHYLFFEDMETNEARQCFKKLIRQVSFPPDYKWITIKWFE